MYRKGHYIRNPSGIPQESLRNPPESLRNPQNAPESGILRYLRDSSVGRASWVFSGGLLTGILRHPPGIPQESLMNPQESSGMLQESLRNPPIPLECVYN